MSSERIIDLARSLKLGGFVEAYRHQTNQPTSLPLSFDERLTQLLVAEDLARTDNRRFRLQRTAKFRMDARPEDYHHKPEREIDRQIMAELYACHWVKRFENVVINGPSGAGKSWISCSLGYAAVRLGYTCLYFRIEDLVDLIEAARQDGTWPKLRKSLTKVDVLILDDFGLVPIGDQAEADIFRVIEARMGGASTIICGQLTLAQLPTRIRNPHLADAIMDRFNNAHRLNIKGPSNR